jgi:hypothetical protein
LFHQRFAKVEQETQLASGYPANLSLILAFFAVFAREYS